jgi:hypothetical protein
VTREGQGVLVDSIQQTNNVIQFLWAADVWEENFRKAAGFMVV